MPWPRGKIPTLRELDQKAGSGTRPHEFAKDVQTLREMLDRFTQLPDNYDWKPHRGLGTLSYSQWMRLGYLHADHHSANSEPELCCAAACRFEKFPVF